MAKQIITDKGFKVIELTPEDIINLRFGNICTQCNKEIKSNSYYIAVLNDIMDKDCYEAFINRAIYYPEDSRIEERNFKFYSNLLGL